jgi:hypothetical protein
MTKRATPDSDPYLRKLHEHWDAVISMYRAFDDHAPIIEFEVATDRILAYAAEEYIDTLTERTRERARSEYRRAVSEGALMVFVCDATEEVLRSYVFSLEDQSSSRR